WLLAARIRGPGFALLAVGLIATDGMVFVMSRVAMNDIYVTGCAILAMYAVYRYWTEDRLGWLLGAGLVFGVGLTVKWNIASLMLGAGTPTFGRIVWQAARRQKRGRALMMALGAWTLGFVVAPPLLYLASYIPYFVIGYSWSDFVRLHKEIFAYHRLLKATH